jgi:thiol-disulfide isomerase/thioredoxin
MKCLKILFILYFFIQSNIIAKKTFLIDSLIIAIENNSNNKVWIEEENNPFVSLSYHQIEKKRDTILIPANNVFRIIVGEIDSTKQFVYNTYLFNRNEKINIKINQNNHFVFNPEHPERENELNFFNRMRIELGNFEGLITYISHKRKDPLSLYNEVSKIYLQRIEYLKKYKDLHPISENYQKFLTDIFLYKKYHDFLKHCELTQIFEKSIITKHLEINAFLDDFSLILPDTNSIYYLEAANYIYKFQNLHKNDYLSYHFEIEKRMNGLLKDYFQFNNLENLINSSKINTILNDFLNKCENDNLKKNAIHLYSEFMEKPIELDLSQLKINNINLYHLKTKKIVQWEDLIGPSKIKYIDFWASWCGGCRTSMPKVQEFEKAINNPDFKVIYISIDKNSGVWEKISKKENLPDENSYLLINSDNNPLLKKFNINLIPRYMLIDHKGNVFDENAPNIYQMEKLMEKLNELLNK